jgi:hypothetical protein
MDIPTALAAISSVGNAARALAAWRQRTTGDARSLVDELSNNLRYLDLVAEDDVPISEIAGKLSTSEYDRLLREGFRFNSLKRKKIQRMSSLDNTDLASWQGKETEELVFAIYDKFKTLIVKFPYTSHKPKYRWGVRVNNIRKRIWLLLRHVEG